MELKLNGHTISTDSPLLNVLLKSGWKFEVISEADGVYDLMILYDSNGNDWYKSDFMDMFDIPVSIKCEQTIKRDEQTGKPISGRYVKVKDSDWDEPDNVNHPQHYEGKTSLECIDTMRLIFGDEHLSWFCLMNAYKYLWRHKNKNGIEDLEKCEWYLDHATWHPVEGVPDPTESDIYDILKEMLRTAKMDYGKTIDEDK